MRAIKTSLFTVLVSISSLAACEPNHSLTVAEGVLCSGDNTAITQIQGNGPASPLLHQQVTVQGIVTLVQSGKGFYLEAVGSGTDTGTSKAIFIASPELSHRAEQGTLISASGTVIELGRGADTLTGVAVDASFRICSSGHSLPLTDIVLPLDKADREALEAMRIRLNGSLVISDVYQLRRGNFTVGGEGVQFVPTETMAPGPATARSIKRNRDLALAVSLPADMTQQKLLVGGTSIGHITGVLSHDGRGLRVQLQGPIAAQTPAFSAPEKSGADTLRVVAMNLHNYFNGDGQGGDFPTPRGAKTPAEFRQQRNRIGAAIGVLNPHIIAVMELENDGFGPDSAAVDFIRLADATSGSGWGVARPGDDNTGGDKITVGIFYRSDMLAAVGPAQTLTGPEFNRNRQPLAQVFQPHSGAEKILVVVNHLKSKGSCPASGTNSDHHDGQGCWSPARVAAAKKMSAWAQTLAAAAETTNILILGDMNAYRLEDPVNAIRQAGFEELLDKQKKPVYSFMYFGQAGTLDYAFGSAALVQKVQQVFIWHVNAALPAGMELPQPWLRFSDHDPVVVDLRLHQAVTSD